MAALDRFYCMWRVTVATHECQQYTACMSQILTIATLQPLPNDLLGSGAVMITCQCNVGIVSLYPVAAPGFWKWEGAWYHTSTT